MSCPGLESEPIEGGIYLFYFSRQDRVTVTTGVISRGHHSDKEDNREKSRSGHAMLALTKEMKAKGGVGKLAGPKSSYVVLCHDISSWSVFFFNILCLHKSMFELCISEKIKTQISANWKTFLLIIIEKE